MIERSVDILIVGAGPAGLGAAADASPAGLGDGAGACPAGLAAGACPAGLGVGAAAFSAVFFALASLLNAEENGFPSRPILVTSFSVVYC